VKSGGRGAKVVALERWTDGGAVAGAAVRVIWLAGLYNRLAPLPAGTSTSWHLYPELLAAMAEIERGEYVTLEEFLQVAPGRRGQLLLRYLSRTASRYS
jgi:hypothetical protein